MGIILALFAVFLFAILFCFGFVFALGFWFFGAIIKIAVILWLLKVIFGRRR